MLRKLAPILLSLLLATSVSAGINFDDASSQFLSGTTPITGAPFTVCVWFNSDDGALSDPFMASFSDDSSATHYFGFGIDNNAPDPVRFSIQAGSGTLDQLDTTTGNTTGQWHLGCFVANGSADRDVYIDGGSSATSTVDRTPTGIDVIGVGANLAGTTSNFFSGDIAHLMIWDVALSASNIADLFVSSETGQAPNCVNSADLIRYWPFANSTDLTDTIGSQTLTANNSPTNSVDDPTINQCATGNPFIWLQLVK